MAATIVFLGMQACRDMLCDISPKNRKKEKKDRERKREREKRNVKYPLFPTQYRTYYTYRVNADEQVDRYGFQVIRSKRNVQSVRIVVGIEFSLS